MVEAMTAAAHATTAREAAMAAPVATGARAMVPTMAPRLVEGDTLSAATVVATMRRPAGVATVATTTATALAVATGAPLAV